MSILEKSTPDGTPVEATARGVRRRVRSDADGFSRIVEPAGAALAGLLVLVFVLVPILFDTNTDRVEFAQRLQAPSGAHLFGTDASGRDILARVIEGGRISLTTSLIVIVFAVLLGAVIALICVLAGGVVDTALMRFTDIGLAFPSLILALGIAAAMGPSLQSAVVGVAVTWWPRYARLLRAMLLQTMAKEYVEAAREMGVRLPALVRRHILPDIRGPLLVQVSSDVSSVTLTIAGLSFIGVGAQPPMAEWGAMISAGNRFITSSWWVSVFPGVALALTGLAFGLLGEWIRRREEARVS
ncbi:ABC transporter permease subunit [Nakamurella sp. YIM 132087]|uniref:ABC transporter permease subunit n=1 Tax=Nakamurella alba TaxID=2665158 RepID=A0A7K1FST1_9ACTN|nr:ABC transporter permease [Nakamurella alba]MTD17171.1 ABC transporter permease subunit [Nakamurella alba]